MNTPWGPTRTTRKRLAFDASRRLSRLIGRLLVAPLALFPALAACSQPAPAHEAAVLTVPVRVFLYSFADRPELDATLDEPGVRTLFAEVNRVWSVAGIEWRVQSIERRRVAAGAIDDDTRRDFRRGLVASAPAPDAARPWTVVIMRKFPVPAGGVYLPEIGTLYYAQLNKFGESHAEILAHELGHSLGLRHVDDADNLMQAAGAEDGAAARARTLTAEQIATARAQVAAGAPAEGERRPQRRPRRRR